MNLRQSAYLAIAVAALLLTGYHNLQFVQAGGGTFSLSAFIDGVFANHASASIGWDITMACLAFVIWMLHEAKRIGMRHVWVYVLVTFLIAFGVAAPLFLFMRDRHLARKIA
ncbi:MAG: DUF2834 domain-containing protein [Pseudomonadota bacterium]